MPSRVASTAHSPALSIWLRHRAQVQFVVLGTALFIGLNATLYYPYAPGGFCAQLIQRYLSLQAGVAGAVVALFDPAVQVKGPLIIGRFPLRIVMECTALDAQALFAAFVLAFRARWPQKLCGLAGGIGLLWLLNTFRIVALYFIGLHWPEVFSRMHEEVLALVFVAAALLAFVIWTQWVVKTTPAVQRTVHHGSAASPAG